MLIIINGCSLQALVLCLLLAINNVALKAFFDRGFVTLPKMATPELIHRALKVAEFWTVHRNSQTCRNMFGGVSLTGGVY